VRRAVYEATPGGWRLAAHARAAAALEARARAQPEPTTSSRRRPGDEEAIALMLEAARATRRAIQPPPCAG
jgi:hypothetical protein